MKKFFLFLFLILSLMVSTNLQAKSVSQETLEKANKSFEVKQYNQAIQDYKSLLNDKDEDIYYEAQLKTIVALINLSKYDESAKTIYNLEKPKDKLWLARYLGVKLSALKNLNHYRAPKIEESKTDPTKFTRYQLEDAEKEIYTELWALRKTLTEMTKENDEMYFKESYFNKFSNTIFDTFVDDWLSNKTAKAEDIYEEAIDLGSKNRKVAKEYWNYKYLEYIGRNLVKNSKNNQKDYSELIAPVFAYVAGQNKQKTDKKELKKYLFEAETQEVKTEVALESARLYRDNQNYVEAHNLVDYCLKIDSTNESCKNYKEYLEQPTMEIENFPSIIEPNKEFTQNITISNTNLTLNIYKLTEDQFLKQSKEGKLLTTKTYEFTYKQPYTPQEESFTIPALKSGLYKFVLNLKDENNDTKEYSWNRVFYANVSNLALVATAYKTEEFPTKNKNAKTLNINKKKINVFTLNAKDGNVENKVKVSFDVDNSKTKLPQVETSLKGQAENDITALSNDYNNIQLRAQKGENLAFANLSMYKSNYKENAKIVLNIDRKIYKPTETLQVAINVIQKSNDIFVPYSGKEKFNLEIKNNNYKTLFTKEVSVDSYGQAVLTYTLPQESTLGSYTIIAQNKNLKISKRISFRVEQYKQPEFEVSLQEPKGVYAFDLPNTITGKANYYFGGAVKNAKVSYKIEKFYLYPWFCWYFPYVTSYESPITGEVKTDDKGNFAITFTPRSEEDVLHPARYNVEVNITDDTGRTITAEQSYIVSKQEKFFTFKQNQGFFIVGEDNYLELNMVNAAEQPLSNNALIEIFKAEGKDDNIKYSNNFNPNDFDPKDKVFSGAVVFQGEKLDYKLPKLEEGFYLAKLTQGGDSNSFVFYVVNKENSKLDLPSVFIPKYKKYYVGENATFLLGNIKDKGAKYVEVYKNGVLITRKTLGNNSIQIFNLPITKDYQGGLTLRWFGVYDYQIYSEQTDIEIPYINKNLKIQIDGEKVIAPDTNANLNLSVIDENGKAINGRAIVSIADSALTYYVKNEIDIPSPYTQNFGGDYFTSSFEYNNYGVKYSHRPIVAMGARSVNRKSVAMAEDSVSNDLVSPTESIQTENMRQNFVPNAYWNPTLDIKQGKAQIKFKTPSSFTRWDTQVAVFTKDLQTGKNTFNFASKKDLMVRLETPRFLRQGDEMALKTILNNESNKPLQVQMMLSMSFRGEVKNIGLNTTLSAGAQKTFSHPFTAPYEVGDMQVAVVARAGALSDGEVKTFPILNSAEYLTESETITIKDGANNIALKNISSSTLQAVHLTLDTSLLAPILQAIPLIVENTTKTATSVLNTYIPLAMINQLYQTMPELKKVVAEIKKDELNQPWTSPNEMFITDVQNTPWYNLSLGYKEQVKTLNIFDAKLVSKKQEYSLKELEKYQNKDGGFAWIVGGKSSIYITLQVLDGFARASYFGVKAPTQMVKKALAYLDKEYKNFTFDKVDEGNLYLATQALHFAYVLSAFDKTLLVNSTRDNVQKVANFADKFGDALPPIADVYGAVVWHRLGDQTKAQRYLKQLFVDSTKSEISGTSFMKESRSWQIENDNIALQSQALLAVLEIAPNSNEIDGLVKWLLMNKKANLWGSTEQASMAVKALLEVMKTNLNLEQKKNFTITWNGETQTPTFEPFDNPKKTIFSAYSPLTKDALQAVITKNITPTNNAKAQTKKSLDDFASLTALFVSEGKVNASTQGPIKIEKEFYLIKDNVATKLNSGDTVSIGDQVEVRLVVMADNAFEFVYIEDPKPATFEAEKLLSTWVYDGLYHYQEMQNAQTNFYMDNLPKGTYEIKYYLRPTAEGLYKVGATNLQSMYAPEFSAHSSNFEIRVK